MSTSDEFRCNGEIPNVAGTSFKPEHIDGIVEDSGSVGWFEVHPENYMVAGGPRLAQLEALRNQYSISLHGVGLSLGAGERPNRDHLQRLKELVLRYQPGLVSEHLAWVSHDGLYFADLLPTALTKEVLDGVVDAIDETQQFLGRSILIENPSSYLPRPDSWLSEIQFLDEVSQRSGCGLLMDVNNVYISATNIGFDAGAYIDAVPAAVVGEIHLAGHSVDTNPDDPILIDTHGARVADPVWQLYDRLVQRIGARPTLIEWDTDLPEWSELRHEAELANQRLRSLPVELRRVS
ncbi:MAG: DUF692 domain-containing protein [Pseudomonadota bacterium]